MVNNNCIRLFGLNGTRAYATKVSAALGIPLNAHIETSWDDGEFDIRADCNVRNCACFVVQSLYSDNEESISDKLQKLIFFCSSLWHASAGPITAVIPYMGFSRQDRKDKLRAGVFTQYVAIQFEGGHISHLLGMDFHSKASIDNGFRMRVDELQARKLLASAVADDIRQENLDFADLVVLSPDVGGGKRAELGRTSIAKRLPVNYLDLVQIDKMRKGKKVFASRLTGPVKGKKCILWDDMISTASSMDQAYHMVRDAGGEVWGAVVSHGLLVGDAPKNLANIPRIYITDTVDPCWRLPEEIRRKFRVVDTAHLFAEAIRRTYADGGSISELLDDGENDA